jgi:hypothetical protein
VANTAELDCKIYLEAPETPDAIAQRVFTTLGGSVSVTPSAVIVLLPSAEVEVRDNEDADAQRTSDFPDGFLKFRYVLEVYPSSQEVPKDRGARTAKLLEVCWSRGWPAVAACAYEDELPHHGGYKDRSLPWPVKSGKPQGDGAVAGPSGEQIPQTDRAVNPRS